MRDIENILNGFLKIHKHTDSMFNFTPSNEWHVSRFQYDTDLKLSVYGKELNLKAKLYSRIINATSISLSETKSQLFIANEINDKDCVFMSIATYISPHQKRLLKKSKISFGDLSGDLFIFSDDIIIDIQTPNNSADLLLSNTKNLSKKMLIVVENLILNPRLLEYGSVREIQQITELANEHNSELGDEAKKKVSLGTIHSTIKFLHGKEIIGSTTPRRKIRDSEGLLDLFFSDSIDKARATSFLKEYGDKFKNEIKE